MFVRCSLESSSLLYFQIILITDFETRTLTYSGLTRPLDELQWLSKYLHVKITSKCNSFMLKDVGVYMYKHILDIIYNPVHSGIIMTLNLVTIHCMWHVTLPPQETKMVRILIIIISTSWYRQEVPFFLGYGLRKIDWELNHKNYIRINSNTYLECQ